MNKKEVIEKIKKCLRLSASANEHEAAIALRQAQALMEKYGIGDDEMLASEAGESYAKTAAKAKPSKWETALAGKIAKAFGCRLVFIQGLSFGQWSFIGTDPHHEIACYTFDVLKRQCKKSRAAYIKAKLKRCSPANAMRRADLFCEGWIFALSAKINAMVPGDIAQKAIAAFVELNYPDLIDGSPTDRNKGRALQNHHHDDRMHGFAAGQEANLNQGVDQQKQGLLG